MERWRGNVTEYRPKNEVSSSRPDNAERCVLLYSHDTYGLGHFRRNSAIAHALRRQDPYARIIMLTGSSLAGSWRLPDAVEVVTMPGVVKVGVDDYRPLTTRSMSGLIAERAEIIASTLLRARPDVFLVDHAPLGMKGELRRALESAHNELPNSQVILGLRDILDDPETVRRTWTEQGIYRVLASLYDEVLVYGSRELFDAGELYGFGPTLRRRTIFTGYVAKDYTLEAMPDARVSWTHRRHAGRRVLVTGGGGGDAAGLFNAFLAAWPAISRLGDVEALLVTGPLMPEPTRRQIAASASGLARVHLIPSSHNMLRVIAAADAVVSMAGYNSIVEVVSARRPLVLWPRTAPRREQLIRARLLERLGLARVVLPGPTAVHDLEVAVVDALEEPAPAANAWRRIDLRGGDRIAYMLREPSRAESVAR